MVYSGGKESCKHQKRGEQKQERKKYPPKYPRLSKPLIHQTGLVASTDDKPKQEKGSTMHPDNKRHSGN